MKRELHFLGWVAAVVAGCIVFLYSTFASKDELKTTAARIVDLQSAINRIDQRTWEAWGKPRGEPPPRREEK